jgi:hypothetical protein
MGGVTDGRNAPVPPPAAGARAAGTGAQGAEPLARAAASRRDEGQPARAPSAGSPPAAGAGSPHVLPCALVLLGPLNDAETGRPLSELLRAIGYL